MYALFTFFQPLISKQKLYLNGEHNRKSYPLWLWGILKLFLCMYFFLYIKVTFLYYLSFSNERIKTTVYFFDILTPTIAMLF